MGRRILTPAVAELLGTFGFMLLGGSAVLAVQSPWTPLAFGPAIGAMIYLFAPSSGAHFNPAVTMSLAANHCFPLRRAPGYIAAHLLGATGAAAALHLLFTGGVGALRTAPAPGVPMEAALAAEIASTSLLALVILRASCRTVKRWDASLSIGGAVVAGILMAGPVSSASMNPARTLGPAFVLGQFDHLGVYLAGPLAGGLVAAALFRAMGLGKRCREALIHWSGEAPGEGQSGR